MTGPALVVPQAQAQQALSIYQGQHSLLVLIVGKSGRGKALSVDTAIPTPDGWTKMGDLQVGDTVFAPNGAPCGVVNTSPIFENRDVWEVSNQSGNRVVADGAHEWLVRTSWANPTRELATTRQLYKRQERGKRPPLLRTARPLDLPKVDLPIHPYVLGLWLGDGESGSGRINTGTQDRNELISLVCRAGYSVTQQSKGNINPQGLCSQLRKLGLISNKHIPLLYRRSSEWQRATLLNGLIDSDGGVSEDGRVEYTTILPTLAVHVHELLSSLGIRASLNANLATLYGKDCGTRFRINFYMKGAACLRRKEILTRDNSVPGHYLRFEYIGKDNTRCITVDSTTHEFLCGEGMFPTHNSTSIRTLPPERTHLINVTGKELPFPESRQYISGKNMTVENGGPQIRELLKRLGTSPDLDYIVLDDGHYIMVDEFMAKVMVKGYDKFSIMGRNIYDILVQAQSLRPGLKVFILWHEEETASERKMKTLGKLLDEKVTPEGLATIVLWSEVEKIDKRTNKHYFSTQTDGMTGAKAPMGMFPPEIPNDLLLVAKRIDEYYQSVPLAASKVLRVS